MMMIIMMMMMMMTMNMKKVHHTIINVGYTFLEVAE
jgi:hypothetical protein